MKLTDIKQTMANALEINSLRKEVNLIETTAADSIAPLMETMSKLYDGKVNSPIIKDLFKTINKFDRKLNSDKFFKLLGELTTVVIEQAKVLDTRLDKESIVYIMKEDLNVTHAHTLQFMSMTQYFLEVCRVLSIIVTECEIAAARGDKLEKSTISYIERNLTSDGKLRTFIQVVTYLNSKKKADLITDVYDLPDIKVDEMVLTTIQTTEGRDKIDPSGFNAFNLINPTFWLYSVQKVWSEFQLKMLELNEDELKYLELRHQEIQLVRENKDSPHLTKQIDLYEDRIRVTRLKINRLKEKMG